jgi:hypothetical protein
MINRLKIILLLSLCLPSCKFDFEDKTPTLEMCYDIVIGRNSANESILINKCTGETWMMLRETAPKEKDELTPSYTNRWYKINKAEFENTVAGIKKSN